MIELYTAATPNGWKASITLEELAIPYEVKAINLMTGDQKTEAFQLINPNGRIPAIVDTDFDNLAIFESGAIMIHLAEQSGKLLPSDPVGRSQVMQWLMFQMGGIGPMMGQANVFNRYLPDKIEIAINRYLTECRRLFEVLDKHLENREFLAGPKEGDYSIADIANFCWVKTYKWSGVDIDGLENLKRWMYAIRGRDAVERGLKIPFDTTNVKDIEKQAEAFAKGARTIVTGA